MELFNNLTDFCLFLIQSTARTWNQVSTRLQNGVIVTIGILTVFCLSHCSTPSPSSSDSDEIAFNKAVTSENIYQNKSQAIPSADTTQTVEINPRLLNTEVSESSKVKSHPVRLRFKHIPEKGSAAFIEYKTAMSYLDAKDENQALHSLQRLSQNYPQSFYSDDSLFIQGQLLKNKNQLNEARQAYLQLLEKYPDSPLYANSLIEISTIEKNLNLNRDAKAHQTLLADYYQRTQSKTSRLESAPSLIEPSAVPMSSAPLPPSSVQSPSSLPPSLALPLPVVTPEEPITDSDTDFRKPYFAPLTNANPNSNSDNREEKP